MQRRDRIGLTVLCILLSLILYFCSRAEYMKERENASERTDPAITTQGNIQSEDVFYLKELNGYVVVYRADMKTIYEYTNISIEELPLGLQREIKNGIKVEGLTNVFGFLENYSS